MNPANRKHGLTDRMNKMFNEEMEMRYEKLSRLLNPDY